MAPPTRAVLDTVRRLTELRPARALPAEAVQRSFTTLDRLSRELAAGSQRGSAIPRQVLAELVLGTQSVPEIHATWEIDSLTNHMSVAAFRSTIARNQRYVAAGVLCPQTVPSEQAMPRLRPARVRTSGGVKRG